MKKDLRKSEIVINFFFWLHMKISPVSFWFVDMDTRKLEITYVAQLIFLLGSAVLDPEKNFVWNVISSFRI